MSFHELTQYINRYQVHSYSKLKRHIVIRHEDFKRIQHRFKPTKTVFHWWRPTWRSTDRLRHWHAVKFDEFVELHCDFGNLNRHYLLGLLHLFVDVLGYMTWCFLRHGKPWHKRDFSHLKDIKTHHPFHLANVFSARIGLCLLDSKLSHKKTA
ncbi:hypothetical protein GW756_04120 [bacterium]|nr:hypothetical protein [bacterium]NCQ55212.1 hypothetical protein [Candidatus Parcubacteria bacterium]NCS67275.1 hypothetical protein [Candidatus Peregrinibacteria bacterium]NCS96530.1 hypothetical protein [bacterium]